MGWMIGLGVRGGDDGEERGVQEGEEWGLSVG